MTTAKDVRSAFLIAALIEMLMIAVGLWPAVGESEAYRSLEFLQGPALMISRWFGEPITEDPAPFQPLQFFGLLTGIAVEITFLAMFVLGIFYIARLNRAKEGGPPGPRAIP